MQLLACESQQLHLRTVGTAQAVQRKNLRAVPYACLPLCSHRLVCRSAGLHAMPGMHLVQPAFACSMYVAAQPTPPSFVSVHVHMSTCGGGGQRLAAEAQVTPTVRLQTQQQIYNLRTG